jgi:cytochrome c oxidase subunit I+III
VLIAVSMIVFLVNVVVSLRRGRIAGDNPWEASGLEWATTSPPPVYNFLHTPVVTGREPLWEDEGVLPVMTGIGVDAREALCTTIVEAEPDIRQPSAGPTAWPLIAAIATTALFIGSIFHEWALVWGAIPVAATLVGWFWPSGPTRREAARTTAEEGA